MKLILIAPVLVQLTHGQTRLLQLAALALIVLGLSLITMGLLLLRRTHRTGGKTVFGDMAAVSLLGDRSSQQDFFLFPQSDNNPQGRLAIVCDGMGGLAGGEQASRLCAQSVFTGFYSRGPQADVCAVLRELAQAADREVSALKDPNGNPLNCGTTLVAAVIRNGKAYWVSVGDSRIYLYQGGHLQQLTRDHNLRLSLEQRYASGMITREQLENSPQQEALISFIGKGRELLIDSGEIDFTGEDGELLLLCSDGLYKSLGNPGIESLLQSNPGKGGELPDILAKAALQCGTRKHDNTTVLVIGR